MRDALAENLRLQFLKSCADLICDALAQTGAVDCKRQPAYFFIRTLRQVEHGGRVWGLSDFGETRRRWSSSGGVMCAPPVTALAYIAHVASFRDDA